MIKKAFDAVKMVRKIRDQKYAVMKNMTDKEILEYYKKSRKKHISKVVASQ